MIVFETFPKALVFLCKSGKSKKYETMCGNSTERVFVFLGGGGSAPPGCFLKINP